MKPLLVTLLIAFLSINIVAQTPNDKKNPTPSKTPVVEDEDWKRQFLEAEKKQTKETDDWTNELSFVKDRAIKLKKDVWLKFPKVVRTEKYTMIDYYNPSKFTRQGNTIKFWIKSVPVTDQDAKEFFLTRLPIRNESKYIDFSKFKYNLSLSYLNCKERTIGFGKSVDRWDVAGVSDKVTFTGEISVTVPTVWDFKPTMADVIPDSIGEHYLKTICAIK